MVARNSALLVRSSALIARCACTCCSRASGAAVVPEPLAIGGVAVGADGVMVEVHPDPDSALSDAEQQLTIAGFADLMAALVPVHAHVSGGASGSNGHGDAAG